MVLCRAQGMSLAVLQQLGLTQDDVCKSPHLEKNQQFSDFAGRACLAVGSLSLVVGIATPAHANTAYTLSASEYAGQSRVEKLQRLQAGVSLERRIQAQQLRSSEYFRAQSEELQFEAAQFAPALHNQAQDSQAQFAPTPYGQVQSAQPQYEQFQYEPPVSSQVPVAASINTVPSSYLDSSLSRPADGVYLYGQQPVPDQLETAYLVFESQGGSVTGAFYMPSSSFDCVQGQMASDHIAFTVTDSYSQEVSSYALDLDESSAQVASTGGVMISPPSISGYHQLPVSDRDRSLLATCQANY